MSSFGSSLINKSGRRVAPKAGARRRAAAPEGQDQDATPPLTAGHDIVDSIEPVATGGQVLQAQIDFQNGPQENSTSHGGGSEAIAAGAQAVVSALDASNNIGQPHKRTSLSSRNVEEQDESAATLFVPRDSPEPSQGSGSESINARFTRSRATNSARRATPPSSHYARRATVLADTTHESASDGEQARIGVEPPNATAIGNASQQSTNDANWVVTTQDQLRQKADASRRRQALQKRSTEASVSSNMTTSTITATVPSPVASSRLANLQKRKQKKEALRSIINNAAMQNDNAQSDLDIGENDLTSGQTVSRPLSNDHQDVSSTAIAINEDVPRRARKRAATPDEMENVTIVDSLVTMAELSTRERKYGKKSDRERKMRLIDWTVVKTRRREEEIRMAMQRGSKRNVAASNVDDDDEDDDGDLENEENLDAALSRVAARNRARRRGTGIRIRVVNGEHVIDEQSQRVDRHALANEDLDALEEVEEEELTQRFNSSTYVNMKRRDPADRIPVYDRWSSESTDKFYDCLRRFGTDFMIISKMFPGRTRRQIKAKFVREERADLKRVHEALSSGVPAGDEEDDDERYTWDLNVYRENAGIELTQLLDPREVERELESVRRVRELAIEERRKETEEMKRQRRLAGEVTSDEEEQQVSAEKTKSIIAKETLADDELEEVEEYG